MLVPKSKRLERVIIYGDNGSGKSSAYISLAQWYKRTKTSGKVRLLDANHAWAGNAPDDGSLDDVVEVYDVDVEEFDKWTRIAKLLKGKVSANDWIVIDQMDQAWEGAQRYYWGRKTGNDSLAELWLTSKPQDVAGDHGTNWGVINKVYGEFRSQIVNAPCHVLMLCAASPIREPGKSGTGGDDLDTRNFYEGIGYRMEGQKGLRGDAHTVIFARQYGRGAGTTYVYTTVKERGPIGQSGRNYLVNQKVAGSGFVGAYLMGVAGWKVESG